MDTYSLVYHIKMDDFYVDIASEFPTRFDTSAHRSDRSLPVGLNKKVTGLMKDEMGGDVIEEFIAIETKAVHTESIVVKKKKVQRNQEKCR